MKKLFLLLLWVLPLFTCSQENYLVTYDYSDVLLPITVNGEKRYANRGSEILVIGDTLSVLYRPSNGYLKKNGIYGARPLHHAQFINVSKNRYYSVVAFPKRNHPFLITDTVAKSNWILTGETKTILGYACESAYVVTPKNDTISAWFTRTISYPLGPFFKNGLPGLILEAEDHTRDIHIKARKIQNGEYIVALPRVESIVTSEEYRKGMDMKRKH